MHAPAAHPASPTLDWVGDCHLRVGFDAVASRSAADQVRSAYAVLRDAKIPALRELTPAYATILLAFDPGELEPTAAACTVRGAIARSHDVPGPTPRTVEVPVCYDGSLAPDLADVADRCSLTAAEVVALHCGAEYAVAFVGFSPGFPYLTGLPERLNVPRHDSPRPRVAAGSVAIAGDQAGIYPHATPGGWRILGRTPLRLFDSGAASPALLALGDRIRFTPISLDQFLAEDRTR